MTVRRGTLLPAAALLLALCTTLAACEPTRIKFANKLPSGRLENLRWEPKDGDYDYNSPEDLGPGQVSTELDLYLDDPGRSGPLFFDLVVDGARVALFTRVNYKAVEDQLSTFAVQTATPVQNLLVNDEAAAALGSGDEGHFAGIYLPSSGKLSLR